MLEKSINSHFEQIVHFLQDRQILIVDSSKSFSTMMQKTLREGGLPGRNVMIANDERRAQELLDERNPQVIVSEYKVGKTNGLSYAQHLQKSWPSENDRIFILVTANSSESTLVEALDEEVDGYLLKPFSANRFVEVFSKVVGFKVNPPPYNRALQAARTLLDKGDLENAALLAEKALVLKPELPLAYACLGDIYRKKGRLEESLNYYEQGLAKNVKHYKCLREKFDILEELKRPEEAYVALKVIYEKFPLKSAMMSKAFQLAYETGNLDDLPEYYESYKTIEDRPPALTEQVCHYLCRAAGIALKAGKTEFAEELCKWAVTSSGRDGHLVGKIVRIFVEEGKVEEAEEFFELYPPGEKGSSHHGLLDFYLSKAKLGPIEVIEKGRQMIAKGYASVEVYSEIISGLIKIERKTAAENIALEASKKFPDEKEVFAKLFA